MFMDPKPDSTEGRGKKVYTVRDIHPIGEFIIDILDIEYNPIKELDFGISVDGGNVKSQKTDNEGTIKVARPKEKLSLYFYAQKGSESRPKSVLQDEQNSAEEFVINILDTEHNPIIDTDFGLSIDDGNTESIKTDSEGAIKIIRPKSKFNLSVYVQDKWESKSGAEYKSA
jgi:hypothetical protein